MPLVNFVAETADGKLFGFAEVDLRSHAHGCSPARPVGYLEGWYVAEEARHSGIGRSLLSAAEDWARSHGCVAMPSDTWIDKELSETCHKALGFVVVTGASTTQDALASVCRWGPRSPLPVYNPFGLGVRYQSNWNCNGRNRRRIGSLSRLPIYG
ncbi:MAG: GNAT family N-acetyltransferase [Bryobacteraceae bacterium]